MSADLTKGPFGHFSIFYVIQSKAQTFLIKLSYTYKYVAMATAVHMDYTLPLKQGTSFQMRL